MKAVFANRGNLLAPLDPTLVGPRTPPPSSPDFLARAELLARQRTLELLYESRFASLQRFIGFAVALHAMGKAVQDFWPRVSLGLLRYDMSRSQSMMRIASTASPVSGMEVRERAQQLRCIREWESG